MKLFAIAAGIAGAMGVAACSSSTSPGNGPVGGHSAQIEAVGMAQGCTSSGGYGGGTTCTFFFNPTPDTITTGTAVSFKFDDVGHTVTWDTPGLTNIGTVLNPAMNTVVSDGMPAAGTYA